MDNDGRENDDENESDEESVMEEDPIDDLFHPHDPPDLEWIDFLQMLLEMLLVVFWCYWCYFLFCLWWSKLGSDFYYRVDKVAEKVAELFYLDHPNTLLTNKLAELLLYHRELEDLNATTDELRRSRKEIVELFVELWYR